MAGVWTTSRTRGETVWRCYQPTSTAGGKSGETAGRKALGSPNGQEGFGRFKWGEDEGFGQPNWWRDEGFSSQRGWMNVVGGMKACLA